jgi:hypothetical protein
MDIANFEFWSKDKNRVTLRSFVFGFDNEVMGWLKKNNFKYLDRTDDSN